MRFTEGHKSEIQLYILEKIDRHESGILQSVVETYGISKNTVVSYINEMVNAGIIERVGKGKYEIKATIHQYTVDVSVLHAYDSDNVYLEYVSRHVELCNDNAIAIIEYAVSEMVNNVIEHSGADSLKVIIRKTYLSTTVILIDNGIGIFEKIRDHFGLMTLEDAKCELFKGKVTTDPSNHTGEGIFFSSRLMDKFSIISGGVMFYINKFDVEVVSDINLMQKSGTCVCMEISNRTNKIASEIFNAYSSADDGFIKTSIPIKNCFDRNPVSRSQARRLCSGLDRFRTAILDFDGVTFAGQGFMHEIFVLYRRNHPELNLEAINMSPDVEMMYLHVVNTKPIVNDV